MSSRYGGRGYGRYGEPEEDRTDERLYEREAERGYGPTGGRQERGGEYGGLRRGGYAGGRSGYEREYGRGRDYDTRETNSRDYGGADYGSRYGREVFERGGYSPAARRYEGEEYGRTYGVRPSGRDYGRRVERSSPRDAGADEVREYDTDYGRTTSRFYGRSGYEYGREDYEDERAGRERRDVRGERGPDGGSWLDRAADQVRSWFGGDEDDRDRGRYEGHRRGEGKFRGLGPKNYRRSDERVRDDVCDRLADNEWLDASDIEVGVAAAEVILTGTVDSRYAKRLAENIAESVSGVSHVQNNLRVRAYDAVAEAPLAGMDTPLPAATTTATIPAADITNANDAPDVNNVSRSSKAAGRS